VKIILKIILEKQGMIMVTNVDWPRVIEGGRWICERSTVQFSDCLTEEVFHVSSKIINVLKHPVSSYFIWFCRKSTVSYVHLC